MIIRALLAVIALPGLVAFAVPLLVFAPPTPQASFHPAGVAPVTAGTLILVWCVRDFLVLGRGTLAPWDPPHELVVRGLYRYSRNPMYVGVLRIVGGWALALRSVPIAAYAAGLGLLFHLRVVLSEEPFLARTHGENWERYAGRVHRWIGWSRSP